MISEPIQQGGTPDQRQGARSRGIIRSIATPPRRGATAAPASRNTVVLYLPSNLLHDGDCNRFEVSTVPEVLATRTTQHTSFPRQALTTITSSPIQ